MTQEPQKSNVALIVITIIGVVGTIIGAAITVIGNINVEKLRQETELTRIAASAATSPQNQTANIIHPTVPPTTSPIVVSNTYNIMKYDGVPGTQRSAPLDYIITIKTVDFLQIEYSVNRDGCSDVFLHILWDDNEITATDHVGSVSGKYTTGSIELSPYISQGRHKLTISPEGVAGGCNIGALGSWAGTLIVHTNEYP